MKDRRSPAQREFDRLPSLGRRAHRARFRPVLGIIAVLAILLLARLAG